ncbi:MAG TPA: hypothetical protein VHK27_06405, partial [Gammaproteobacteria bacterium]|nr:hypothetical protein [Gammaproteobacteria bacterium]
AAWGWDQFSEGPVEVHVVPGDHLTMMTEPHVQVLAERLKACLNPTLSTGGGSWPGRRIEPTV